MKFEEEMLIVLFGILLIWLVLRSNKEGFHVDKSASWPIGWPQYGLRGDLLRTESIDSAYIKRYPNVRLNNTNNEMYDSDRSPPEEGINGCHQVPCPWAPDDYYKGSPCWKCSGSGYEKQAIMPLWPHVKN